MTILSAVRLSGTPPPPAPPSNVKKPAGAFGRVEHALSSGYRWLDEHSSPRANTAGNLDKPSFFQAAFNGAADGFYVFGPFGLLAGAGSGCAGIAAQRLSNRTVGVVAGAIVGAALGAAAHFLGHSHMSLLVASVSGGFIGAFETLRSDWSARGRDSGNGSMISAPFVPGPGKLAGGIGGMLAAHVEDPRLKVLIGAASAAALGAAASLTGVSHCSVLLAASVSAIAGGAGPFFGPRYSQFFRNVAGDIGSGVSHLGQKAGLLKKPLKGNLSMALVSIPSSCAKEGVRAMLLSGGNPEAILFGCIKESVRQFHIFLHMRDETPHLPPKPAKP